MVITGAGSGIGEATAKLFAARGAQVVVTDILLDQAERVAGEIAADGGVSQALAADISVEADAERVLQAAHDHFGVLAVVVNNAGRNMAARAAAGQVDAGIADAERAVWEADLGTTLLGTMFFCKHAVRAMMSSGGGSIVNVSSIEALLGDNARPAYSASKAGIISLTRHVASTYGTRGIRCNAVAPGVILTEGVRKVASQDFLGRLRDGSSMGRLGEPSEVAEAIYFLASPAASYITGQVLAVDGGTTSRLTFAPPLDPLDGVALA